MTRLFAKSLRVVMWGNFGTQLLDSILQVGTRKSHFVNPFICCE
uniref:Uncharacterized protein n=1 Tax=Physcomitrium patens TaxID=3218 RepID=A0A2K1JZI8_PHYPA|nr:hypothetical protein PHYPA_014067 [Physcomitrium patens]